MKKENERVTIIIPLYNTKIESFKRCLESIMIQSFKDYDIIVVNDCSTIDYRDTILWYQQHMKLNVINMLSNVGPGAARQIALNNATGKYVLFVDSDDELLDKNSLQKLYDTFKKNPNTKMVAGRVIEEFKNKTEKLQNRNFVWIFAKLFDREFLIENRITFNDARANEDNAFTTLFKLVTDDYVWLDEPVYKWKYEPTSLTRKNSHAFYFYSIEAYINNMIWIYKECIERDILKSNKCLNHFCCVWIRLYFCCIETLYDRDYYDANLLAGWCHKFYEEVYKKIEPEINDDKFMANYSQMVRSSIDTFADRICNISYPDFYNIISSGNPLIED